MKIGLVQDSMLDAVGAYMSRLSQRQQIVASNLANIDTPGYKTKDVSFHATMQELLSDSSAELRTSRSGHIGDRGFMAPQAQTFEVQGIPSRADQNNIDLDREMMKLSETSFGYSMMSQILKGKFRTISNSINGGNA